MQYLSLFQLNQKIQTALDQQLDASYWVVAEIGELRINQKGHCYMEFVEKDHQRLTAKIRANLWAYDFHNINSLFKSVTGKALASGMKVLAKVMVQFHEIYGLSLQVKDLDPNFTLGERARLRQMVIDRLNKEGIADANRRLSLPLVPQRIAVISSSTAAGYGDFIDQLINNKYGFSFEVNLFESVMQGSEAIGSITRAFNSVASKKDDFDLLVLIRGGGSQVDLDCFDSYEVASEIARFPIPVVTGIGHQRDDTIADRMANTKIKTPTAVAEFLINGMMAFDEQLNLQFEQLKRNTSKHIENQKNQLFAMLKSLDYGTKNLINSSSHSLSQLGQRLESNAKTCLKHNQGAIDLFQKALVRRYPQVISNELQSLKVLETRISMADPENVLKRGYSITYLEGKVVKKDTDISEGDELMTKVHSKSINSKVIKIINE